MITFLSKMYDLSGGSYLFIIKTSNKLDLTICLTLQFKKKGGKERKHQI